MFKIKKNKIDTTFQSKIKPNPHIKYSDLLDKNPMDFMCFSELLELGVEYPISYVKAMLGRKPKEKHEYQLCTITTTDNRTRLTEMFGKPQETHNNSLKIWSFSFKNEVFFVLSSKRGTTYEMIGNDIGIATEFFKNIHQRLYSQFMSEV